MAIISNTNTRVFHGAAASGSSRKREIRLWITQGAVAAVFLLAGVSKLVMPAEDLTKNSDLSAEFLRFIGVCETLGPVGLVLPWLLNIRSGLTPLAAAGLVIIMVGAVSITAATMNVGAALFPLIVGVAALSIALGRRTRTA